MTIVAEAAEGRADVTHDFSLADGYDPEYLDTDDVEDVDLMSTEQRQALNAGMADWYGVG